MSQVLMHYCFFCTDLIEKIISHQNIKPRIKSHNAIWKYHATKTMQHFIIQHLHLSHLMLPNALFNNSPEGMKYPLFSTCNQTPNTNINFDINFSLTIQDSAFFYFIQIHQIALQANDLQANGVIAVGCLTH